MALYVTRLYGHDPDSCHALAGTDADELYITARILGISYKWLHDDHYVIWTNAMLQRLKNLGVKEISFERMLQICPSVAKWAVKIST